MNGTKSGGRRPLKRRFVRMWCKAMLTGATIMVALTGCASLNKKFVSGTKADIGLFADNTIALLSDLDLSIDRNEAVFARRFFNEGDDQEKEMIRRNC